MADDDSGRAGEAGPNDVEFTADQMAFVPDGGRGLPQMRVVAEDGRAGDGHGAIYHPVVAGPHQAEAAQLLELLVLFQHPGIHAAVLHAGRNDQWVRGVIACF